MIDVKDGRVRLEGTMQKLNQEPKDEKHGMCDLNLTRSICGEIFYCPLMLPGWVCKIVKEI